MADHFPLNELPPELRIRVWEACLPHRTIFYDSPNVGISRTIFHDGPNVRNPTILGPPAIAQVCQESRAVAFEHGSPQTIVFGGWGLMQEQTWYDASRDTIVLTNNVFEQPTDLQKLAASCRVLPTAKSVALCCISMLVEDKASLINNRHFQEHVSLLCRRLRTLRESVENLECVKLILQSNPRPRINGRQREQPIFVDLTDEKEVETAAQILPRAPTERGHSDDLMAACGAVRGKANESPVWPKALRGWEFAMKAIKYQWLQDCFSRDEKTDPTATYVAPGAVIDEGNAWVQSALAELPPITPVFLLYPPSSSSSPAPVQEGCLPMRANSSIRWDCGRWVKKRAL